MAGALAKATGYWFPRAERALATAIFDAAAKFSNVIGAPLVALAVVNFGWRGAFWCLAAVNFAFFIGFLVVYRDPSADRRLSPVEYDHIRAGGGVTEGAAATDARSMLGMLGYLLRTRKIWGLTIGFAAYGYFFALFLTWLPNYLVREMHMSILHSAAYTAIPWGVATVTDLAIGGWLIDYLIQRGNDETWLRKSVLVIGILAYVFLLGRIEPIGDPEAPKNLSGPSSIPPES